MASTWSALKIELLETGANSGTWGTLTNINLGDAVLGEAITGSATVDFSADADVTVTLTDSATTQSARNLRLNITESGAGIASVRNLILGSGCQIEKFYLVRNNGTGAKTVKNTSGTGISVPAGKATLVYNDGTNVVDGASYFTSLTLGSALPVASGGTGLTSGTSGGIPAYTATGTLTSSAALTQYGVVYGGGANAVPVATANGTTGQVLTATTSAAPSWATPTQTYPGVGIANSTGSAWGTSYTTSGSGTVVALATSPAITTSITTASTSFTALAGATTLLTLGGTGASAVLAIPGTLEQSSTTGALTVAGGVYVAKKLNVAGVATLANGAVLGTPASGNLGSCTQDGTNTVGFLIIPQNSQSAAYTLVLADAGKHIFHPSTDANARTYTIPANGSVAYVIGTAITFINMTSQVVTIAITTDTMYLSSAGTTGSRSLAQYGSATAIKMTSTTWLISGSGLT